MTTEALEQKVSDNRYNELRLLDTIDVYAESTAVLYTGPMLSTPGLTPTNVGFNTTDHGFRPMPWEHQTVLEEYGSGRYGNRLPEERQTTLPEYGIGNLYNQIGSQGSEFKPGSKNNLIYGLGNGLQERYDWSRHNDTEPHINYDLIGAKSWFSRKALGNAHFLRLVGFDE